MISTHVLDLNLGQPAAGVVVQLEVKNGSEWSKIQEQQTNLDGRVHFETELKAVTYRLNFIIGEYLQKNNVEVFFTSAPIIFKVTNTNRKYHIPLLLNAFGYSTYRGS